MVSTSLLITTTDYLPGSVDGSLISRSWFVVLSPAASLLCAISSLHHHSGHEIPEFGSLFAIDCSELPLPAKANNASNIMRHGVGTEFHGRLLSSIIKCICLVMVALALFQQKKPTTFTSQFIFGGGGAFEETYFWFLTVDRGCVEIHVTLYLVSEGYVFKFTRHPLLFFLNAPHILLWLWPLPHSLCISNQLWQAPLLPELVQGFSAILYCSFSLFLKLLSLPLKGPPATWTQRG
jgi:hypothetical protein